MNYKKTYLKYNPYLGWYFHVRSTSVKIPKTFIFTHVKRKYSTIFPNLIRNCSTLSIYGGDSDWSAWSRRVWAKTLVMSFGGWNKSRILAKNFRHVLWRGWNECRCWGETRELSKYEATFQWFNKRISVFLKRKCSKCHPLVLTKRSSHSTEMVLARWHWIYENSNDHIERHTRVMNLSISFRQQKQI